MNQELEPKHLGEKINVCRVLVGKPEGKNHLEDLAVDGRMILKWTFKKWDGGMEWIDLAQERNRWRTVVNAVMDFSFHKIRGVSWLVEYLLPSQEGHCSMFFHDLHTHANKYTQIYIYLHNIPYT